MKLLFNNTDFYVIIGANPFDNIVGVANCVIDYVAHLDTTVLKNALAEVGAILEISFDSDDIDSQDTDTIVDKIEQTTSIDKRFTLKSTGEGKLDINDNDRLHQEWLKAFANILRPESVQYWKDKIGKEKDYDE